MRTNHPFREMQEYEELIGVVQGVRVRMKFHAVGEDGHVDCNEFTAVYVT